MELSRLDSVISLDVNGNEMPLVPEDEREIQDDIERCASAVTDKQRELVISRLRFLSTFYVNIIENKQSQMNMARTLYKSNPKDVESYIEWMACKAKIKHLYEYWLRELLDMVLIHDGRAICMHQMMAADCYWFLAKVKRPDFHSGISNLEMAARCIEKILSIMSEHLPTKNAFYVHLLKKYALIVRDYSDFVHYIPSSSRESTESFVERMRTLSVETQQRRSSDETQSLFLTPNSRDFAKCRHSIVTLKLHAVRLRNSLHLSPVETDKPKEIAQTQNDMQEIEDIVEQFN